MISKNTIINTHNGKNILGGQTALIKAAQKSPMMVVLLIEHGACNSKAEDAHHKTASDYAIESGFIYAVQLLQSITPPVDFPQPFTRTVHDLLSW